MWAASLQKQNTCRILTIQHNIAACFRTTYGTLVWNAVQFPLQYVQILYIRCNVRSLLSDMCLSRHCCLFVFFVFSFYRVMFSFIMQTPLGEEKLLFHCKYSSLFWCILVLHCIHSDVSPEWTPSKPKSHCATELCVPERWERCIQVKNSRITTPARRWPCKSQSYGHASLPERSFNLVLALLHFQITKICLSSKIKMTIKMVK